MDGAVVRKSSKIGFCFMPTTALHFEPVKGPRGMGYSASLSDDRLPVNCGERRSTRVAMSLQAGWGDEYYQGIAGQSFDVSDLPNGSYRLRISVNPKGDLAEITAANNIAERLISLEGNGADRELNVPQQGYISAESRPLSSGWGRTRAAVSAFGPATVSAAGPSRLLCGLSRP